jgi:TfoX/Sxy family transcriptional regulator of competence genes
MAWTKIPPEHQPLFAAALPDDERIETLQMFGGFAAKVNGNMFGGTFARSVMLLLSEADRAAALALPGAAPFDPMGNGAMRSDKVQMPDALMADAAELKRWVKRSFDYAVTLPAKAAGKAKPATKPAKKPAKKSAKKPAPKSAPKPANKVAAKQPKRR